MRFWIAGWAGACLALGLCALALAYQGRATGPIIGGVQVGMGARDVDGAQGVAITRTTPSEWYIRGLAYRGAPADLWVYRDAARDSVEALRWRQDFRFAPPAVLRVDLPPLAMSRAPSDEGCTAALMRLAGLVQPFAYAGPKGAFGDYYAGQLREAGFTAAEAGVLLAGGQAYAEGFETASQGQFGCNFVFTAQRRLACDGYSVVAQADVRLDWVYPQGQWRMYRMSLQIDVKREAKNGQ